MALKYRGPLFGQIGRRHILLEMHSDEVDAMERELSSLRSALADERDNNARHTEARAREVAAFEAAVSERNAVVLDLTAQVERLREALEDRASYYYERGVPHQSQHPHCRCRECVDKRVKEALAATADTPRPTCAWTYDDDTDSWDTECGEKWQFTDGGPEENGVKFCHGCGRTVLA